MSFITTIQSVLRKKAVSPKKANRISLLEPPFLALPQSPERKEEYYVLDDSFTSMAINEGESEVDKTYYENDTLDMYTSDVNFLQGKNASNRKRSLVTTEVSAESTITPISPIPARLFQTEVETIYSPPAKRAPILRRIRAKLSTPLSHPPRTPLMEDDEDPYVIFKRRTDSKTTEPASNEVSRL